MTIFSRFHVHLSYEFISSGVDAAIYDNFSDIFFKKGYFCVKTSSTDPKCTLKSL